MKEWDGCSGCEKNEKLLAEARKERDEQRAENKRLVADGADCCSRWKKAESALDTERGLREKLWGALSRIAGLGWTPITDGSGPIDCTPNEKGLLGYCGSVVTIAKEALSDPSPKDWLEQKISEAVEKWRGIAKNHCGAETPEALDEQFRFWSKEHEDVESLRGKVRELEAKIADNADCPCIGAEHHIQKCPYFRAEQAETKVQKLTTDYAKQLEGFWAGICGGCATQKARAEQAEARAARLAEMVESALMLSMDGECDTCGYDPEDEDDKHAENCEAHALEIELRTLKATPSEGSGKGGE